ncbi:MAG: hypothetical protein OXR68_03005 [Alphaproteobacteria bacterium]|nr:hypothetical protein [Alphaproteobacteria bacterium]MDD9919573.1 hypothetical protein [Alphaproteobacteria bacterium]
MLWTIITCAVIGVCICGYLSYVAREQRILYAILKADPDKKGVSPAVIVQKIGEHDPEIKNKKGLNKYVQGGLKQLVKAGKITRETGVSNNSSYYLTDAGLKLAEIIKKQKEGKK